MHAVSNTGHLREGGEAHAGVNGDQLPPSTGHTPLRVGAPELDANTQPQESEYSTYVDKTTGKELDKGSEVGVFTARGCISAKPLRNADMWVRCP